MSRRKETIAMGRSTRRLAERAGYRGAFTLIEILVAVSIMAILGGLLAAAVFQAENAAKYHKTESLITKLHNDIMLRLDETQERRLPYDAEYTIGAGLIPSAPDYLLRRSARQLSARRELQRLDLPDRFSDINLYDSGRADYNPASYFTQGTALSSAYWSAIKDVTNNSHESAECLYLIVTTSAPGDNAERLQFADSDVGDADGDGLKEFHDAWGRPIAFIRWPAGLESDLQPVYWIDPQNNGDPDYQSYQAAGVDWGGYPTQTKQGKTYYKTRKPERNHDPLDVRQVDNLKVINGKPVACYYAWRERGYRLTPLIVSAGRDGVFDLEFGRESDPANDTKYFPSFDFITGDPSDRLYDPYRPAYSGRLVGESVDLATPTSPADGADNSGDNIHNHYLAQSER